MWKVFPFHDVTGEEISALTFYLYHSGNIIRKIQNIFNKKSGTSPFLVWDYKKQGKSEGFDSCDRPSNLIQIGFKSSIFQPVWPRNLMDDPKKQ